MKQIARFVLTITIGIAIGSFVTFQIFRVHKAEYSQELENFYIEQRIFDLASAMATMEKAEKGNEQSILSDQAVIIRGLFQALAILHQSGQYESNRTRIEKILERGRLFIESRPAAFIDQKFVHVQDGIPSTPTSGPEREQLQESLDHVATFTEK